MKRHADFMGAWQKRSPRMQLLSRKAAARMMQSALDARSVAASRHARGMQRRSSGDDSVSGAVRIAVHAVNLLA